MEPGPGPQDRTAVSPRCGLLYVSSEFIDIVEPLVARKGDTPTSFEKGLAIEAPEDFDQERD
jgi:hypothetical protein